MRKPFRDSKLTLYLRPFIRNAHVSFIACLPPYDTSPSIVVKQYFDDGVLMRGLDQVCDTPNSAVYDGMMKYCCNLVPKQIRRRSVGVERKPIPASCSKPAAVTRSRSQTTSRQLIPSASSSLMNDIHIDDLFSKLGRIEFLTSRLRDLEETLDRVLSRSMLRWNTANDRKISLMWMEWGT